MIEKWSLKLTILSILTFLLSGCIDGLEDTAQNITLSFLPVPGSDVKGNINFLELDNGGTRLTIQAEGTFSGGHPVHIHQNTAAEGGPIVVSLSNLDASGKSVTDVLVSDGGTIITFQDLLNFDGHINIHKSAAEMSELIAQADIGQNSMTGTVFFYPISAAEGSNIKGQVAFQQRLNNTTQVTVILENTEAGTVYYPSIHEGPLDGGGAGVITLNPVDGERGRSISHLEGFDSPEADPNQGEPLNYPDLIAYDGHLKVVVPATGTINQTVAAGNIGKNGVPSQ